MSAQDFNLYAHFQKQFVAHPDKELLCTERNRSYRYADIDRESARLANFLSGIGVDPGGRVSVQLQKSPEALCLYLACLRGGFVFQPLNPALHSGELEYFLGNAEPAVVVCDPTREATIRPLAAAAGVTHLFTLDADGQGRTHRRATAHRRAQAPFQRRRGSAHRSVHHRPRKMPLGSWVHRRPR